MIIKASLIFWLDSRVVVLAAVYVKNLLRTGLKLGFSLSDVIVRRKRVKVSYMIQYGFMFTVNKTTFLKVKQNLNFIAILQ